MYKRKKKKRKKEFVPCQKTFVAARIFGQQRLLKNNYPLFISTFRRVRNVLVRRDVIFPIRLYLFGNGEKKAMSIDKFTSEIFRLKFRFCLSFKGNAVLAEEEGEMR